MAEDTGEEDKQFEPSQKKLDDARMKGEIPRSADLVSAAGYSGFLIAAWVLGPATLMGFGATLSILLGQADSLSSDLFGGRGAAFTGAVGRETITSLLPWLVFPFGLALLSTIILRSLLFTPSKLAPKLSRISLIQGVKNKFGRAGLFEFFKSFAKLTIYSIVMALFLMVQLPRIIGMLYMPPALIAADMGRLSIQLLAIVVLIAFVIGGIDFLFQQAEHMRKHRMSRKELMDEQKNAEGDPMMKQQRRQKGFDIAMNQMLANVPEADVIITNPTHYAIALKWNRGSGQAPICLAKGVDEIAARIREIGAAHMIPQHADPITARAIHATVKVGDPIQPDHYRAVAAAIRFAEDMRRKARLR